MSDYRVEIDGVACFGVLSDSSNIEILFDCEELDFIWMTRDPEFYPDWASIVDRWQTEARMWGREVLELSCD